MNWRRACLQVHFPEVIIPETVNIYEGRNIQTIFCLYALAIHLHRLRKAPSIKNEAGNLQFSAEEIEKIKERLQNAGVNISSSGGDFMISKGPKLHANEEVLLKINEAVNSNDSEALIESLLDTDGGFIFVEKHLGTKYLEEFKKSFSSETSLAASQIQAGIQIVNENNALERLERYLLSPEDPDFEELSFILADLDPQKVIQAALPFYDELLRDRRRGQHELLNLEQIHDILSVCNACVQVHISAVQGNEEDVYESLKDPVLSLQDTLNDSYKNEYYKTLNRICAANEGNAEVKSSIGFTIHELTKIVRQIGELSPEDILVDKIQNAADKNDSQAFTDYIIAFGFHNYQPHFRNAYVDAVKVEKPKNKEEIHALIDRINSEIVAAMEEGAQVLRLNNALMKEEEREIKDILLNSTWKSDGIVMDAVLEWYYPTLQDNLTQKRQKLNVSDDENEAINVSQTYGNGRSKVVYVDMSTETIKPHFVEPEKWQKWPLNNEEIKATLKKVNEKFDEHYRKAEHKIRKGQMTIREYLRRKFEIAEEMKKDRAARKIQTSYRKMKTRGHLGELHNSSKPSVDCVRQFIEILRNSQLDYDEDIKIERTRSNITHLIKANQKLDEDLNELDKMIGLLIKNRISLNELNAVIERGQKIEAEKDAFDKRQPSVRKPNSAIAQRPLEILFFHLQAEPVYLSNLYNINDVSPSKFFTEIIFPLFHFASEKREEFLLIRIYSEILKKYIESLEKSTDFLIDSNGKRITEAFSIMFRGFPSHAVVPLALKSELKDFQNAEKAEEHLNLRPLEMYEEVNRRAPESLDEALNDVKVATVLESSKKFVANWTARFSNKIVNNIELPKNIRYLIKACFHDLRLHFRNLKEAELHRLVAKFLFSTYFQESLTDPTQVKRETGETLTPRQGEVLRLIMQMIHFAVDGQGFGADAPYMDSLNAELIQINNLFTSFTAKHLMGSDSPDSIYGLNQYSAFAEIVKPTLHIETKHVRKILDELKAHKNEIIKDEQSKLRQLTDQARIPESETVVLYLRPLPSENFNEEHEGYELFVETKKLLVEVLLCGCQGSNVIKILQSETTSSEEKENQKLKEKNNDQFETLAAKKHSVLRNLAELEKFGLVSSEDSYQAIITQIAKDIYSTNKYRGQRKEQLESLAKTANELEAKRNEYKDQLEKYQKYLGNTLDNISMTSRKPSIQIQNGGKAEKKLNKRISKEKATIVKISGDKLIKKDIAAVQDKENSKLLSKTSLEISNDPIEKGVFHILINHGKKIAETRLKLDFQKLLTAQDKYDEEFVLDEIVRVRPNAFINYLNKKFHQK
uniref:Ras-GAP domain-containing protein n=1 Tax=Panagrolaimus superbus TaxID=310955 RepID=A0A914YQA5_9BILA